MYTKRFARLGCCLLLLCVVHIAQASSTIFDAIILKVNGNTIVVRVAFSPYSSITVLSNMMTHKSGDWKPITMSLDQFETYFIDDIPVSKQQIRPLLVPGARITTFENRDCWYFLRVSSVGAGSNIGTVTHMDNDGIHLTRRQSTTKDWGGAYDRGQKYGRWEDDGLIHLKTEYFPDRVTEITLDDNAVVRQASASRVSPWKQANLKGQYVLVQQARPKMRVELLPKNYGPWKAIETHTAGWGHGDKAHMAGSF